MNQQLFDLAENTSRSIFLTGKAGTGKTTFLSEFVRKTTKKHIVLAPTGIAAINAGGVTIHSMFGLPPRTFLPTYERIDGNIALNIADLMLHFKYRKEKLKLLREIELIIIDEVSMLRADVLDMMDHSLRFVRRSDKRFGGVQMLFIGDLYQFPPVVRDEHVLKRYYNSPFFFESHALKEVPLITIELTTVYRQTDETFLEILNDIREGVVGDIDFEMLNRRYIPDFEPGDEPYVYLTSHNRMADEINRKRLAELPGKSRMYAADIEGTFSENQFPNDEVLELKPGCQVMFIRNDASGEKKYFNGKLAEVLEVEEKEIVVQIDGSDETYILKKETWEQKKYSLASDKTIKEEVLGSFNQYPIRLAWAVTIHKSQGLTFDRLIVDAGQSFASGQVYVALSRCRSLEGIVLLTPIPMRALTNAREVLYFTQNQLDITTTELRLAGAQQEYLTILLCSLYDFRSIINRLSSLSRNMKTMGSVQGDISSFFITCIGGLEGLQIIAERFQQQIRQIVYNPASLPHRPIASSPNLADRLQAAYGYFAPKIQQLLETIAKCPLRTNDRNDAAFIKQHLLDIHAELSRFEYIQQHISKSPSLDGFFRARQSFRWVEPSLVIYSQHRKTRSDASAFKTLGYFYAGLTIPQIAKERNVTVKTIVKHLLHFIEEDLIHISNFSPEDQHLLGG